MQRILGLLRSEVCRRGPDHALWIVFFSRWRIFVTARSLGPGPEMACATCFIVSLKGADSTKGGDERTRIERG